MAKKRQGLKLGKGSAFDKSRLKRLRQQDETWEAHFRALPQPMMQTETHYLGLVVTKRGGSVLADNKVQGRPSANDLAKLLAAAMRGRQLYGAPVLGPRWGGYWRRFLGKNPCDRPCG